MERNELKHFLRIFLIYIAESKNNLTREIFISVLTI